MTQHDHNCGNMTGGKGCDCGAVAEERIAIGKPGRPLQYSGAPLYVVTGKKLDGTFAHISFEPDWDLAVDKAHEAVRNGDFTDSYVSDIHTAFHDLKNVSTAFFRRKP